MTPEDIRRTAAIRAAMLTDKTPYNLAMGARHGDETSLKLAIDAYEGAIEALRSALKAPTTAEAAE